MALVFDLDKEKDLFTSILDETHQIWRNFPELEFQDILMKTNKKYLDRSADLFLKNFKENQDVIIKRFNDRKRAKEEAFELSLKNDRFGNSLYTWDSKHLEKDYGIKYYIKEILKIEIIDNMRDNSIRCWLPGIKTEITFMRGGHIYEEHHNEWQAAHLISIDYFPYWDRFNFYDTIIFKFMGPFGSKTYRSMSSGCYWDDEAAFKIGRCWKSYKFRKTYIMELRLENITDKY